MQPSIEALWGRVEVVGSMGEEEPALYLTSKHGDRDFARNYSYSKVIYSKRVWRY